MRPNLRKLKYLNIGNYHLSASATNLLRALPQLGARVKPPAPLVAHDRATDTIEAGIMQDSSTAEIVFRTTNTLKELSWAEVAWLSHETKAAQSPQRSSAAAPANKQTVRSFRAVHVSVSPPQQFPSSVINARRPPPSRSEGPSSMIVLPGSPAYCGGARCGSILQQMYDGEEGGGGVVVGGRFTHLLPLSDEGVLDYNLDAASEPEPEFLEEPARAKRGSGRKKTRSHKKRGRGCTCSKSPEASVGEDIVSRDLCKPDLQGAAMRATTALIKTSAQLLACGKDAGPPLPDESGKLPLLSLRSFAPLSSCSHRFAAACFLSLVLLFLCGQAVFICNSELPGAQLLDWTGLDWTGLPGAQLLVSLMQWYRANLSSLMVVAVVFLVYGFMFIAPADASSKHSKRRGRRRLLKPAALPAKPVPFVVGGAFLMSSYSASILSGVFCLLFWSGNVLALRSNSEAGGVSFASSDSTATGGLKRNPDLRGTILKGPIDVEGDPVSVIRFLPKSSSSHLHASFHVSPDADASLTYLPRISDVSLMCLLSRRVCKCVDERCVEDITECVKRCVTTF